MAGSRESCLGRSPAVPQTARRRRISLRTISSPLPHLRNLRNLRITLLLRASGIRPQAIHPHRQPRRHRLHPQERVFFQQTPEKIRIVQRTHPILHPDARRHLRVDRGHLPPDPLHVPHRPHLDHRLLQRVLRPDGKLRPRIFPADQLPLHPLGQNGYIFDDRAHAHDRARARMLSTFSRRIRSRIMVRSRRISQ